MLGFRLDRSVAFDPPSNTDDGYGGVTPGWGSAYECPANFKYLRHGEQIMEGRLAGRETIVVRIRANPTSRQIDASWRMRDLRSGRVYNVAGTEVLEDRHVIEVLVAGGEVA